MPHFIVTLLHFPDTVLLHIMDMYQPKSMDATFLTALDNFVAQWHILVILRISQTFPISLLLLVM